MKRFLVPLASLAILLGGCTQRGIYEVSPQSTNRVYYYQIGTIEEIRPVVIKDNGTSTFLGAITGAVLGSMIGKGKGNTLATLAGGLTGAYVGSQLGKANAQELTIHLDNGEDIVVIIKGLQFYPGERVRVIKEGRRVMRVEPL